MQTALLKNVRDRWGRLAPTQQVAGLVAAVGIVATLVFWVVVSAQVPYEVAFRDLADEEAAAVVEKLNELKIPYELDGRGSIRVPASMVNEARIRVAGSGILRGGSLGYEIFNQPSFGLSDFIQRVNYQRALEGEIARSIGRIEAVESARVHLALPRPSLFVSEQRDPSAAVVVKVRPGRRIDSAQAKAITNLVVGAVEGMKPEDVVLLDTEGQVLHQAGNMVGAAPGAVNEQFALQRTVEGDLESRLQQLLDQVVGVGRADAQVSLQFDWRTTESTSETFVPDGPEPQVRTSEEIHEVRAPGAAVGGVPGVESNVPTYQQNGTAGTGTQSERTEARRTYELSRTVETVQQAPGMVSRISVAVVVDSNTVAPEIVDSLTPAIQSAVGYDASRGDTVTVVAVPFDRSEVVVPAGPLGQPQAFWELARLVALVLGPVLAIVLLRLLLRRRRALPPLRPHVIRIPEDTPSNVLPPSPLPDVVSLPQPQLDPKRRFIREQLAQIADRDPTLLASILQAWLKEDRRKPA